MNVKVPAMTARATPACNARADTAPSTSVLPELELELLRADGVGSGSLVLLAAADESDEPDEGVAKTNDILDEDVVATRVIVEDIAEVDMDDVDVEAFELTLPPVRYGGAATALVGSVRAPVPQGIASPLGWLALGGGTITPVASAMAKRPVQVWVGELGELNW